MAKRKRLDPARISAPSSDPEGGFGGGSGHDGRSGLAGGAGGSGAAPGATAGPAPETKSMFPSYPQGVYAPPRRAPIADVAGDAASSAAFAEMAEALQSARAEGRMIQRLPLDAVDETYLVRDRMVVDAEEMQALCDSLRARGQQAAIEVADLGDGRWGLISGWRRLAALRRLRAEGHGDGTVLALARRPAEAAEAYLAMVEENEIRVGLSFYERARIVARAVDKGVFRADRVALPALFHAVPRAKRSKIGSFVRIVRALDAALRFPAALTERAGLALAAALESDPDLAARLTAALRAAAPDSPEAEAQVIAAAIGGGDAAGTEAGEARGEAGPASGTGTGPGKQEGTVSRADRDAGRGASPDGAGRGAGPEDAAPDVMRPGLSVTAHSDGRITLAGPAMRDPAFRARLLDWLREA